MFRPLLILFTALAINACAPTSEPGPPAPADPSPRSIVQIGEACGGLAGIACAGEETGAVFCRWGAGQMCGAADQMGVCSPVPQACTREYRPVCGCDGETYANTCLASAARVSVVSEGACPT